MTINRDLADLAQSLAGGITTLSELVTAATSGIVESNANFIDACLVGPSVDGKAWAGKFENGSVWSSLMLATVETSGSDAEVNIWDLTTGTLASATPLATLTLTGATPTSIAASMGYVIVGTSDQGMHIVDPHGGSWAERTDGWPRSSTAATTPATLDNNVNFVATVTDDAAPFDPRTGGKVPGFIIGYGAASKSVSFVKWDGNIWDATYASTCEGVAGTHGAMMWQTAASATYLHNAPEQITADGWAAKGGAVGGSGTTPVHTFSGAPNGLTMHGADWAWFGASGLNIGVLHDLTGITGDTAFADGLHSSVTNAYNTGLMVGDTKLAALANSATADRSGNSNTLTENGTVTEAAVETGAELLGYSGFSASNYLSRAYDADFNVGTGAWYWAAWVKATSITTQQTLFDRGRTSSHDSNPFIEVSWTSSGAFKLQTQGASGISNKVFSATGYDDGEWHLVVIVERGGDDRVFYVDDVQVGADSTSVGDLDDGTNPVLFIGYRITGSTPADEIDGMALMRFGKAALDANQVRRIYEAENGMFAANAKCLLQGASDAVLDARIDPLTGKYIVTQSDTQDIFDGLAIETERTIAAGGTTFEHGLLWGDGVAEINDANLYASMPATDQRQVNEMVRALANQLPAGVDLGKAKAWVYNSASGSTPTVAASLNVESLSRDSTGVYTVTFATPFKSSLYGMAGSNIGGSNYITGGSVANTLPGSYQVVNKSDTGASEDGTFFVAFFGELENE